MSDQNLAVNGKDTQIVILFNGMPRRTLDTITSFSVERVSNELNQKHLGTSDVDVDIDFEGYKGELEASIKSADVDELEDLMSVSGRARIAYSVQIVDITRYRDGSSKTYTYPDVKFTSFSKSAKRGENSTARLSWRTGKNRIAG